MFHTDDLFAWHEYLFKAEQPMREDNAPEDVHARIGDHLRDRPQVRVGPVYGHPALD